MLNERGEVVYEDIKGKLSQRFGAMHFLLVLRVKLSSLVQGKESLEEYAEEVGRLADRAYKGVERPVIESTAVYTFPTGLIGIKRLVIRR